MTHEQHHRQGDHPSPRDPANTPTTDEKTLLTRLLALDASMRSAVTHLGPNPGDGLIALLTRLAERETGVPLS